MEWLLEQWNARPAPTAVIATAVIAGLFGLGVAVVNAWATLRASRNKSDPLPIIQNTQTEQQGGQGVQAQTISGGVYHHEGISPEALAAIVEKMTAGHGKELRERDDQLQQTTQELTQLKEAYDDLTRQATQADDPDPFNQALAELREGRPGAAETLFSQILEDRKSAGKAARAARHIGAIAFYHDTQKSLDAYQQAVELDPDNADGWNQLGRLKKRIGDLDGAMAAYEKVLHLGNRVEDKTVIAVATSNLGNLYEIRGDLEQAEAMYRKSLDIEKALGRKEGRASDYGNLGNLYRTRGDLEQAEAMYRKSLNIEKALGRKGGMANAYCNLGNVYLKRGDLEQAEAMYRKSLGIEKTLGRKEGMASDYGNLGTLLIMRGEKTDGCAMLADAKRLFAEIGVKDKVELIAGWIAENDCPNSE